MSKHDHSITALARLLDSDRLAKTVPDLAPEVLHQLILHRGLDVGADLVAAATSEQVTSVFDLDLWHSPKPGLEEKLDANRFVEWVEALIDKDPSLAARTVASLDAGLVIAAMSRYIRIFDPGVFERIVPTEEVDHDNAPDPFAGLVHEMAGYIIRARCPEGWDAIVLLLNALEDEHPDRFHEVIVGCRRLSNDRPEIDGLDDLLEAPEQATHDATLAREDRQSALGYVTPGDARAFLEMARRPRQPHAPHELARESLAGSRIRRSSGSDPDHLDRSRALVERSHGDASSETRISRAMRHLGAHDAETFDERMKELAFLAGALVAGCSLGDRPFTPREAQDAAIAVCNLGLEQWPGAGIDAPLPDDFLKTQKLVAVFETGWAVLHEQVSLFVADRLIATLRDLRCHDLDTRRGLIALERELIKHRAAGAPWRAREALDVIAILDMTAWTSLLGLLSECPVLPGGAHRHSDGRRQTGGRAGVRVHLDVRSPPHGPRVHGGTPGSAAAMSARRGVTRACQRGVSVQVLAHVSAQEVVDVRAGRDDAGLLGFVADFLFTSEITTRLPVRSFRALNKGGAGISQPFVPMLLRGVLVERDERHEVVARHQLEAALLQRRVVAAVVADFVEDRAAQEIVGRK